MDCWVCFIVALVIVGIFILVVRDWKKKGSP